jgi:hypothetical protein
LSDELKIRNVHARFCHYLDERRFDDWSRLFTEDGEFQGLFSRAVILEEILKGGLANRPELFRQHITANFLIDISADEATVKSDLLLNERDGDGPWILRTGKYRDRMVRTNDGEWLFAQRLLDWTQNPLGQNG